jgi:DNA-binding response OmpR family regulator
MTPSSPPAPVTAVHRDRFLLVVIDDAEFVSDLTEELGVRHIDAVVCADPAEALLQVGSLKPDAVLTAATLPAIDSPTLVRVLRQGTGIPVILGVGGGDDALASAALAAGAAACVARPYRPRELLQVLRSIQPDTFPVLDPALEVGALRLDPTAREAHLFGRTIRLPMREFQLLQLLVRNAESVVTREQIKTKLWGSNGVDASNSLTVHVQRLRTRLGDDPQDPTIIETVRGLGYRLHRPVVPNGPSSSSDGAS